MERDFMRNMAAKVPGVFFVLVLLSFMLLSPSASRAGAMQDLGTLGGTDSVAYAINNAGQIVGSSYKRSGATHAFLYAKGAMTDLGTLGGDGSEAYAISNAGQIVGASFTSMLTDTSHAFLYSEGKMTDLGTLSGRNSAAAAINSAGQIVGGSHILTDTATSDSTPTSHAFLYYDGAMTDLGTLGGKDSYATGINDLGQVVGWSDTASGEKHAFLYSDGNMTDLGTLGGNESLANAINSKRQVVGGSSLPTGATRAFLYYDGTMSDLGTLGGENSYATGINDLGQVVGWSDTTAGESHGFLYSGGKMMDLGTLRRGYVSYATAINDVGLAVGWSLNSSGYYRAVRYPSGSISARPSSLNFGLVGRGGKLAREVTIMNYGPGILTLSSIEIAGPDKEHFLMTHDCDALLISRGSCTVTMTFNPDSYGSKTAALTILSNDPRKPSHTIPLRADCPYPRMLLTPSSVDFGRISQKQTSDVRVVTITNTSLSDLSISSITVSDEVSFSLTDSSCLTVVKKGNPCPIKLTFAPQSAGPTSGLLTVVSDDQKGSAGVRLHGRGK